MGWGVTHIILRLGQDGVNDAELGKGVLDKVLPDHLVVTEGEAGLDEVHVLFDWDLLLHRQELHDRGIDLVHDLVAQLLSGQGPLLHISDEGGENRGELATKTFPEIRGEKRDENSKKERRISRRECGIGESTQMVEGQEIESQVRTRTIRSKITQMKKLQKEMKKLGMAGAHQNSGRFSTSARYLAPKATSLLA